MSFLIDTHAHLYLPEFDEDRDRIIDSALHNGVEKILMPNIDSSSVTKMNALADKYPAVCFSMMGLHPTSVKENFQEELAFITNEIKTRKYIGIGETGIDLYWDKSYIKEQCAAFTMQIELALIYGLPVIIHARESLNEILEILEGYKNKGLKGIFHAFTGTIEHAQIITDMDMKLGIGGILTYRNSDLPSIIAAIDLHHFVLETDSPYLAPVPMRGKRNESSYIRYIAASIANIKGVQTDQVADVTTATAMKLFGLQ
jgi:TatD DNase family protein